jgi:hypothetical protein
VLRGVSKYAVTLEYPFFARDLVVYLISMIYRPAIWKHLKMR